MPAVPKTVIIRDRKYLDFLRGQPCMFTGAPASEEDPVEAMHIGTLGKGIKSSDDEALPVRHSLHQRAHQRGEMTILRDVIPMWLFREALRAYARERYQEWLKAHRQVSSRAG